jgi:serine/threonine-protein kinase
MGAVYLAHHSLLGRRAAIKVLLPALSARPDIVNRFFNEARAVTSISDPGIVQVFDFGYHTDGSAYLVMEYLEGETLHHRLTRLGRLPVHEALRLCRQIASSLAAAHAQRIVHRDLKPENIFLVLDGEVASGERSKILDFGIAKLSDDRTGNVKTSTGALIGTPLYMSPEQCRGLAEIDHRSDIYALGCVLFHLLTGRPPFEGEGMGDIIAAHIREPAPPPSSRHAEIAPDVDALVMRCLAKAPADRFPSMAEVVAAIAQILPATLVPPPHGSVSGMPAVSMKPPTTLGSGAGQLQTVPARARRAPSWIAGIAAAVAAGAVVVAVVLRQDTTHRAVSGSGRQDAGPGPTDGSAAPVSAADRDGGIAAVPDADAGPIDAGLPVAADAAPVDAPARRPHRTSRPPPRSGSAAPAGCDRSIDTDCDGIPDVR